MTKPPGGHGERDANNADRLVGREESGMALGRGKRVRPQTGQVPHDSLVRVDRRVKEMLASEDALDTVSLAVSEATTNAVIHAFVGRPPGRVSVIGEP